MKPLLFLCVSLILLPSSVLCVLAGEDRDEFESVVSKKRKALIAFYFPASREAAEHSSINGFFISKDGLALCHHAALCRGERPSQITTAEGRKLEFPDVLQVFPDQSAALVKFETKTDAWIELEQAPTKLGTRVAVLDREREDPAVLGPLFSRSCVVSTQYRHNIFVTYHSIGSGMRIAGGAWETGAISGAPVINAQGLAVAVYVGATVADRQTIPLCVAIHELPPLIAESVKGGKTIPFPLPEEHNPYDPVVFAPTYADATNAYHRADFADARRHMEKLKISHPGSFYVRALEYEMAMITGQLDRLEELAEALKPESDAGPAEYVDYYSRLAQAHLIRGDFEEAIQVGLTSVKISPKNYSGDKEVLGMIYAKNNQFGEARKWYRAAATASPEKIAIHERLERVLGHLGKWDEQRETVDRIYELEALFQSR